MSTVIGGSSTPVSSIPKTDSATASSSSSRSAGTSSSDLQQQFMTLLIAQLKNQDPTNPASNTETTSQLAQINTVSGIEKLNATLQGITGQIGTSQQLQASALKGRGVLVSGDRILVANGSSGVTTTPFGINLASSADKVKVKITNDSGAVIRSFDLGAQKAGTQSLSWDGLTEDGATVAPGKYHAVVEATADGQPVNVQALNYAVVNGVLNSSGSGSPQLDLGTSGDANLSDVYQIF